MNRINAKQFILLMIRLILGITFVYASWHKILNPADFAKTIYGYGIFPNFIINILAIWIPYIELIAGVCLITGFAIGSALLTINLLILGFIIVIIFNLVRGWNFDCGCFSFNDQSLTRSIWIVLSRDFILLTAGLTLYKYKKIINRECSALIWAQKNRRTEKE